MAGGPGQRPAYLVRLMAKYAQEIPAWRELTGSVAELCLNRMFQYGAFHDWVEQAGLDPNAGRYPYLYYKHTIPRGYAGVYNAPGYCGNGLATAMAGLPQSFGWAPADNFEGKPPYVYQQSPGVGRRYNPDPVYANGSSNMMYKGYALEQFAQVKSITGTTRYDGPQKLVYDEQTTFDYSSRDVAQILAGQLSGDVDENGSSLRMGVDCEVGKVFRSACRSAAWGCSCSTSSTAPTSPPRTWTGSTTARSTGSPAGRTPTARSSGASRITTGT